MNKLILKKILVTLGVLVVARVIYFIPLPGIELKVFANLYKHYIEASGGSWIDCMAFLHVGKLRNISLFSLGLMPFLNACVIMQIIGFLLPALNKKFSPECGGRSRMFAVTLLVTILLSAGSAYLASAHVEVLNSHPEVKLLHLSGGLFRLFSIISMSAAVVFLIVLSEIINRFGIGNGIGLIFGSEIIMRLIFSVNQLLVFYGRNVISVEQIIFFFSIFVAFIYFTGFVTNYSKRLELEFPKKEKCFLIIRPEGAGVWPVVIAELIFSFFRISLEWKVFFSIFLVILFISLFYSKIVYPVRRFYDMALTYKSKSRLPKGAILEDFVNTAVMKTQVLCLAEFALIYCLPVVLPLIFGFSFLSAGIFGIFGIIILVGIYYDFSRQIKFFRRLGKSPQKNWKSLHSVFDESEAGIIKAYLKTCGIDTEIKSSNFRWGLPIKTVVSSYEIFTPDQQYEQARNILLDLWKERREAAC